MSTHFSARDTKYGRTHHLSVVGRVHSGEPHPNSPRTPPDLLEPFVQAGMTVLEPGPGMGFFTLELARLVGPEGRVIAVDVQPQMIAGLRRRAERARLIDRIETRRASATTMGLEAYEGAVDFVLAFAIVHETPSTAKFFTEAARAMKSGASLLAEPAGHVSNDDFENELALAAEAGLPSLAALLKKA
jgi:ubiquinone/menaquinone biosynthesis C-methylase UbiE